MTTSTLRSPVTAWRSRRASTGTYDSPTIGRARSRPLLARLWRGPTDDPAWARPALVILLCATAAAYLVNLTASGWANAFYSAAVQAGSQSWTAFFYGSSDAANAITVDKPPAALWVMALSVRLLGLSSFSILLPEVLMGVASVGVLYATVKRHAGPAAGLVAGVTLALTPVATLMFRFNNPDALLVLLMTLGAWATVTAIDEGRARWLVVTGLLLGLGFLTKTLQVFLVLPALATAYLLAAKTTLRSRVKHLVLAGVAMVVSAGWWVAVVELVPASLRPYVGGSQDNSFLSLTFGYNGFGRLTGDETGSVGGGGRWGSTGITRLFTSEMGGQISWLLPSALLLLVVGLVTRGRRPRTDGRRAQYLVWGGWLVVTWLTFSFMAGIFHAYYTVALAPAIAALVGMGAVDAWERSDGVGSGTLGAVTALASAWSYVLLLRTPEFLPWLRWVVLVLGLTAAVLLLVVHRVHRAAVPFIAGIALVAVLAGPAAYSAQTLTTAHTGSIVTAGPSSGLGGMGGRPGRGGRTADPPPQQVTTGGQGGAGGQTLGAARGQGGMGGLLDAAIPSTEVVSALSADASQYTWVAAAVGSQSAAGLQLGTQLPVMAIGGFNGTDPSPTLAQFQGYVAQGSIHYLLASSGVGGGSGTTTASQILSWAASRYETVTIGGTTFYDLTQPLS